MEESVMINNEELYSYPEGFEEFLKEMTFLPEPARKGLLIGYLEYLAVGMV